VNILRILIVILWVAWLIYWLFSALQAKRSIRNNNWQVGAVVRIAIFILVLLFLRVPVLFHLIVNIHTKSFYTNPFVGFIGLVIFLSGCALSIWARVNLGKDWGMPMTEREKPQLITSGPYAFIRHPIYSGMILAMLGTTIVVTIFYIIPFVAVTIYFFYTAKVEERDMLREFPDKYKDYKKRTKALIPFIY
jgi:protein-S-isoprenylcysteine O-methyltransferase Ste14